MTNVEAVNLASTVPALRASATIYDNEALAISR
jgi:hypothetical protein